MPLRHPYVFMAACLYSTMSLRQPLCLYGTICLYGTHLLSLRQSNPYIIDILLTSRLTLHSQDNPFGRCRWVATAPFTYHREVWSPVCLYGTMSLWQPYVFTALCLYGTQICLYGAITHTDPDSGSGPQRNLCPNFTYIPVQIPQSKTGPHLIINTLIPGIVFGSSCHSCVPRFRVSPAV